MTRPLPVALFTGLVLAAILTYPTIVHPASMARIDAGDGRFSVWNVAWVAHALVDDPRHLFDANIFYPAKGALAYSEANLVAGALAAPVYALTRNPVTAHNVVVYAVLVIAFLAMWALVRRLTGDWMAALVSATAFAFCPNVSSRTAEIQLLMIFVFPVTFLALHRFVDRPRFSTAALLGVAMALAGLASAYFGIFAGLAMSLALVWFGIGLQRDFGRWWRYLAGFFLASVVSAVLVAPVFVRYLDLREQPGARGTLNLDEARTFSADSGAYLRSASWVHRWWQSSLRPDGEVLFPGAMLIGLGAVGVWATRRRNAAATRVETGVKTGRVVGFYAALGLLSAWASFGPQAGLYTWLAESTPFMGFLRAPARFGILVTFSLAVLAGYGVAHLLRTRRRPWLVPALMVLAAVEGAAIPWPLRDIGPVPEVYQRLAELPPGAVAEFHFPYRPGVDQSRNTLFMFWSMWHWHPLVNGYSDYVPKDYWDIASDINSFPEGKARQILRDHGARYVVVDLRTYTDPEKRAAFLKKFDPLPDYLQRLVATDDRWLFAIVK